MLSDIWSQNNSYAVLLGLQTGTATLENTFAFSMHFNHIPYDLTSSFFHKYPTEMHVYVNQNTHTRMSIAALFLTAKNWKQFKSLVIIHYSAIKMDGWEWPATAWMILTSLLLSEGSQAQNITYMTQFQSGSYTGKTNLWYYKSGESLSWELGKHRFWGMAEVGLLRFWQCFSP